jgi:hypothetical protein
MKSATLILLAATLAIGGCVATEAGTASQPTLKKDQHTGYYYPKPAEIEVYEARATTLPGADRRCRIGFVVTLVNAMMTKPFPPGAAFFAKRDDAEMLIIVSNRTGQLDTIYRVRALLATLTSSARATPIFTDFNVEDFFTFLDLAVMLGFKQITVSDDEAFSHQILLK